MLYFQMQYLICLCSKQRKSKILPVGEFLTNRHRKRHCVTMHDVPTTNINIEIKVMSRINHLYPCMVWDGIWLWK